MSSIRPPPPPEDSVCSVSPLWHIQSHPFFSHLLSNLGEFFLHIYFFSTFPTLPTVEHTHLHLVNTFQAKLVMFFSPNIFVKSIRVLSWIYQVLVTNESFILIIWFFFWLFIFLCGSVLCIFKRDHRLQLQSVASLYYKHV